MPAFVFITQGHLYEDPSLSSDAFLETGSAIDVEARHQVEEEYRDQEDQETVLSDPDKGSSSSVDFREGDPVYE